MLTCRCLSSFGSLLQSLLYPPFGSVATATLVSSLVDCNCNIIAPGAVQLQYSLLFFVVHCNCNNVHFCNCNIVFLLSHCNTRSFHAHCNCNLSILHPIAIVILLLLALHCNKMFLRCFALATFVWGALQAATHFLHCYGFWKQYNYSMNVQIFGYNSSSVWLISDFLISGRINTFLFVRDCCLLGGHSVPVSINLLDYGNCQRF